MAAVVERTYRVNELTPDPAVTFDRKIGEQYLRYAHMLAARGLVYSSTGNLVMRVPHASYPEGICYVKCMGVSLEEMSIDDLIITDVPTSRQRARDAESPDFSQFSCLRPVMVRSGSSITSPSPRPACSSRKERRSSRCRSASRPNRSRR